MPARRIIVPGAMPSRDQNGRAMPAQLRFYAPGTALDTPAVVYLNQALTTPAPWPLESDIAGRFPSIWAEASSTFDVTWSDQLHDRTIGAFTGVTPIVPAASADEIDDAADRAASSATSAAGSATASSGSATAAAGSATTASTQASAAAASATTATTQAGVATTKAGEAANSAAAAQTAEAGAGAAAKTEITRFLRANESSGFVLEIGDLAGLIAFAIDAAGVPNVRALRFDGAPELILRPLIEDLNGYMALSYDEAGHLNFKTTQATTDFIVSGVRAELALAVAAFPIQPVKEQETVAFYVEGANGLSPFTIYRTGVAEAARLRALAIEPETVPVIQAAIGLQPGPISRGGLEDVAPSLGFTSVMAVDRVGGSGGVRFLGVAPGETDLKCWFTRRDIAAPGAVLAEAARPIQGVLMLSDSKGVGAGSLTLGDLVVNLTAPFPRQGITFDFGIRQPAGNLVIDPGELNDFVPAKEVSGLGETQGTGSIRWLIEQATATGEALVTRFYFSAGRSSQTIAELGPGTEPYANLLYAAQMAATFAAKYGRAIEFDVYMRMGANNHKTADAATVATQMGLICDGLKAAIPARLMAAGFTPQSRPIRFIVSQCESRSDSAGGTYPIMDVAIGQMMLAESRDDFFIANCPYWFKGVTGFSDGLHNRPYGNILDGETLAEAHRALDTPGGWKGFRPKAIIRTGAVIDVEFWGDNLAAGDLVLDTSWRPMSDIGNYGFAVYSAGGSELTISSVAVVAGTKKVRITLASDPGAAVNVTYCWKTTAGTVDNTPGIWGNLRDAAAIPSNVSGQPTRAHWALPFKKFTAS